MNLRSNSTHAMEDETSILEVKLETVALSQELIKIRPDIPIILCTGHSDRIDEDKAKDLGISPHFSPIEE